MVDGVARADGAPVSSKDKQRETKERGEGEAFDEATRQMATSMVEMLSKAETREGQRGLLNVEIPRRLTAQRSVGRREGRRGEV